MDSSSLCLKEDCHAVWGPNLKLKVQTYVRREGGGGDGYEKGNPTCVLQLLCLFHVFVHFKWQCEVDTDVIFIFVC